MRVVAQLREAARARRPAHALSAALQDYRAEPYFRLASQLAALLLALAVHDLPFDPLPPAAMKLIRGE